MRRNQTLVELYLNEVIDYGGEPYTRAEVILDMRANGSTQAMIDRWVQGYELGKRLQAEREARSMENSLNGGNAVLVERTPMPIRMTRDLAFRAGWDEGDRSMQSAGRSIWDEEDADAAWAAFNLLWPLCPHKIDPERWCSVCGTVTDQPRHPTA